MSDETDSLDDQAADEEVEDYFREFNGVRKWISRDLLIDHIIMILNEGDIYHRIARLFISYGLTSREAASVLKKYNEHIRVNVVNIIRRYEATGKLMGKKFPG